MTLPTGTVTFLFTDIQGSTPLWERDPEGMREALALHNAVLADAIAAHDGHWFKTIGDAFQAAFADPAQAVRAALAGQRGLAQAAWGRTGPLLVRMGIHIGLAIAEETDYATTHTLNRVARIMSAAHGGQIILSSEVVGLARHHLPDGIGLRDMGNHRMKGLTQLEHLFQVIVSDLPANFPPLTTLELSPNNLPVQLTSFVGREKELADIKRLITGKDLTGFQNLSGLRLVTLLGPGGTGKTRLMLQVAEEVIDQFPDGVWLVELAPLTDPGLISERVAAALNVQEQPSRKMLDTLADYLRHKELLLLLDNVEHIVRESAEFTEHLLEHCPKLKILVTGREALFIEGETTLQIPSLSLPGSGEQRPNVVANSEAVQLFLARAQAVRLDFAITPQNAAPIAEIVQRLDGIPLALELAAARLRMLTVEQIAARLHDRFRLLTGGRRTALPRQQTLQALIDWSWNLLDDKERALLRRLSVFSGGWTLEAAQIVTGFDPLDEFDVFNYLDHLINKSLVTVQHPPEGEARYGMLESIRQYARDKLFEADEGEVLRDRHADFFVAFAEEAEPHLRQSTMMLWVNRSIQELDNLRTVMAWTLEGRPVLALRLSSALHYEWAHWMHPSEADAWLEAALEKTRGQLGHPASPVRTEDFIKALIALGISQSMRVNMTAARTNFEEGIRLARAAGELRHTAYGIGYRTSAVLLSGHDIPPEWNQEVEEAIAICQKNGFEIEMNLLNFVMFNALINQGKFALAMPYFQEMVTLANKYKNPRHLAGVLMIQANIADLQGNFAAAKQLYRQGIESFTALNDQRFALTMKSNLTHILRREGNLAEALPLYQETIRGWQAQGHRVAVAHQLECFAFMAITIGQYEQAARLLGCAKETRERLNTLSTDPREIAELAQAMAQLAEAMGEVERDRVMAEGRLLKLDEAVLLALRKPP